MHGLCVLYVVGDNNRSPLHQALLALIETIVCLMRTIRNPDSQWRVLSHDAHLTVKLMYQVKSFVESSPSVRAPKVHDVMHYITDWAMFGQDILRNSTGTAHCGVFSLASRPLPSRVFPAVCDITALHVLCAWLLCSQTAASRHIRSTRRRRTRQGRAGESWSSATTSPATCRSPC